MTTEYFPAQLSKEGLEALQVLEKELGRTIVAYSHSPKPAKLSNDQIKRIQSMEECLKATLVAY